MSSKKMRLSMAASAIGLSAGLTSPSMFALDAPESFIEITLGDVLDLDPESLTFMQPDSSGNYAGIPYGTELNVEWWEWDSDTKRGVLNAGCSFKLSVDTNDTVVSDPAVTHAEAVDGLHTFTLSDGCDPIRVGASNSYLRIYPTEASETPVLVRQVSVDSGSHLNTVGPFRLAPVGNRGLDEPWSLVDECGISALSTRYNATNDTHRGYEFEALNANVNPELIEDGADVTSDGGLVVFPERDADGDEDGWVICDAGYIPADEVYFPDQDATFAVELPFPFDVLPNTAAGTHNEDGQGLRNAGLRQGGLVGAFNNKDVLSVVSYNTGAIMEFPGSAGGWTQCITAIKLNTNVGQYCKLKLNERKKIVRELAESVRAAQPDVVVFQEVFQDGISGLGTDNWDDDSGVRQHLVDALSDIYTFAGFYPEDWPQEGRSGNPNDCPSGAKNTELEPDDVIYPDQTESDMKDLGTDTPDDDEDDVERTYCSAPKGTAIDSGVVMAVLKSTATITTEQFEEFDGASAPDLSSSKGVTHVTISKFGQPYHIFGTHMQSSIKDCAARVSQLRQISDIIYEQTDAETDQPVRVLFTGDMNTGPVRNNHVRNEPDKRGQTCRNEFEYLIQKLRSKVETTTNSNTVGRLFLSPNSMPFSNDCALNANVRDYTCASVSAPGDKFKVLDHAVWVGQKPTRSGAVFYRQTANGDGVGESTNDFDPGEDVTGHYPLLSVLDYRTDTSDNSLEAFYDYGSSGAAGFALDRPTMCPYGQIVEYNPDGRDFSAYPDAEPDLLCLPLTCTDTSSSSSDASCQAATLAESNHEPRRMCRDLLNDQNYAAPCIVPAGYENIARQSDVIVTSSGERQSGDLADDWIDDNVVDGRIALWDSETDRQVAWRTPKDSGDDHWVKLTWPTPQYVKRVRFRTGSTDETNNWGTDLYSLHYNDTVGEFDTCTNESGYVFHEGMTLPCSKVFGSQMVRSAVTRPENSNKSDPNVWNVVELDKPVLTDQIVFSCVRRHEKGCSIAELEVYGGAE